MEAKERSAGQHVRNLLGRGGLIVPEPEEGSLTLTLPRYNGLQHPDGAEQLGSELASSLREFDATALLIWEGPQDLVLAYVVARELGVHAIRSYDRDGLVGFEGDFLPEGRVVLVADAFREAEPIRAMCALARHQGQEVKAAGALIAVPGQGTQELQRQGVQLVSLISVTPSGVDETA